MACTPPVRTVVVARNIPIWSKGGTNPGTSDLFVLTGEDIMQIAPLLTGIRATIQTENMTPNAEVNVYMQATNDGCTWEAPVALNPSAITQSGTITTPWNTTAANFTRGLRVCAEIEAASGTLVEMARLSVVIDFELKS